jgi:hypothetical protein
LHHYTHLLNFIFFREIFVFRFNFFNLRLPLPLIFYLTHILFFLRFQVFPMLNTFRKSGRKLFLLTNSLWYVLQYAQYIFFIRCWIIYLVFHAVDFLSISSTPPSPLPPQGLHPSSYELSGRQEVRRGEGHGVGQVFRCHYSRRK